ncbi:MiaB/RimO family radical SAM methylthiotransferase [Methanoculleus sp. FWC-SCC1]|uniref:MiaB/RimO family radical SAM methylthiotransferase n=1 Tax=Methanoculleus frigidifontis TaxID=2584085 RepID=A0ABT8MCT4_9EURY|nr:MiaB/RimO family radical SAM methylthiotransferase [Methanoculleus sp. FWC-SCC1]MDN7025758.1 MiaB/RimO family radical SAM methylthiotransferase [Methanoculleus sp. FWC-SCC1]
MEHLIEKRIYIESYGCTYNHADTQKLITLLEAQGCTRVGPEEAEAVIINTCTVIGATERQMLRRLRAFADKELYVTGCMPLAQPDAVRSVCTARFIHPDTIRDRYGGVGTPAPGAVGIVQIASGCLGRCSYCITRLARGALCSASADAILDAVRTLAAGGAKEIQLTGQDVSAWGRDIGETLPDLLQRIDDIPGRFRLRLGMMNPATVLPILPDLARAYESEKVFQFLHLPVQSGSDAVLSRMSRGYRAADVLAIVSAFRERYPEMIISSDFIVGFPGETDTDFAASLKLLRQAAFAKVNITRYSRRPGTPAAAYKDLTDYVRKQRSRALLAEADRIYDDYHDRWLGRETPVVVTEQKVAGSVICRTPCYMNVVIKEDLPLGYEGRAVVTARKRHYVVGELSPGQV